MGTTALELLIVPLFLGTLGTYLACAAVFGALCAAGLLVERLRRQAEQLEELRRAHWEAPRQGLDVHGRRSYSRILSKS